MRLLLKILMSLAVGGATFGAIEFTGLRTQFRRWFQRGYEPVALSNLDISPGPTEIIDELRDPQPVAGWSSKGIELKDGRTLQLADGVVLPDHSELLDAALREGIEIDPTSGRVFGLVTVWHSCGNDPTRKHIARVDLARLMQFVAYTNAPGEGRFWKGCDGVDDAGWDVGCFYAYERWAADGDGESLKR